MRCQRGLARAVWAQRGAGGAPEKGKTETRASLLTSPTHTPPPSPPSARAWSRIHAIVAANPATMRLDTVRAPSPPARTRGGVRVVTVEPGGLTRGSQRAIDTSAADKFRVLLVYGEHGRELITVEAALSLLADLASPDRALAAADAPGRAGAPALVDALAHTVFKIVPMENEGGRARVEAGALCERKSGRGVDPNRNWGVDWGVKESDYDPSEEFPGQAPFDEPEPAALRALAASFAPHVWTNGHSGMEALFMPWDHAAAVPTGATANATVGLLETLNLAHCGGRCATGSGGAAVGYLAHGTATDYMYDVLRVPIAMTWEMYGDSAATYEECFRMFNPRDAAGVADVARRFADAVFHVVEALATMPGIRRGAAARDAQVAAAAAAIAERGEAPANGGSVGGGRRLAAGWGDRAPPAALAAWAAVGLLAAGGVAVVARRGGGGGGDADKRAAGATD